MKPDVTPPAGFVWKFSDGVWALFPGDDGMRVASVAVLSNPDQGDS